MTSRFAALAMVAMLAASPALPGERWTAPVAGRLCASVAGAVDAEGGSEAAPVFVASYRPGPDEKAVPEPLRQTAFAYDNALAIVALAACGDLSRARRIGDAFLLAIRHDRTFADGRIRNAYRNGPVGPGPVPLPGWWDPQQKLWAEDSYQDGTATGNVAWVALALLTLSDAAQAPNYLEAAEGLVRWILAHARSDTGTDGFAGGVDGYDPKQTALTWKSTEHNLDVNAAATWLHHRTGRQVYADAAAVSRRFLDAMFVLQDGHFLIGTTPDGSPNTAHLALDTQLWPLIGVADAPAEWRRSLTFAQRTFGVAGGFDFNEDRDGLWVEGTAQAAFTFRYVGRNDLAAKLLDSIGKEIAPSGFTYATREPRVTTGLSIGPQSTTADFFYFRRPHLGATAWSILAATGWNPFTGRFVD